LRAVIWMDWSCVAWVGVVNSETWDTHDAGWVERAVTWAQLKPETETELWTLWGGVELYCSSVSFSINESQLPALLVRYDIMSPCEFVSWPVVPRVAMPGGG
jgi:hypothetical protein